MAARRQTPVGRLALAALLPGLVACSAIPPGVTARPAGTSAMAVSSVRAQVLADNERRRTANPEGYARKLAKLAETPFSFFRGTTPLFYRQLFAGLPAALRSAPPVILHGDLHVENFTVLPGAGGVYYGLDDFDESLPGPASIDLIRCLASLALAFGEDEGLLQAWLDGYAKGLDGRIRLDSEAIDRLLHKQAKATQADLLAKRTTPTRPRLMRSGDATSALTGTQKAALQAAVAAGGLQGLDVQPFEDAIQRFAGTASLDLFRYDSVYGVGGDQDRIVEIKELQPSSLASFLGSPGADGLRYRQAIRQYQGEEAMPVAVTSLDRYRMLVRYRPACKDTVSPSAVGSSDRRAFVTDLGKITGQAHARSGRGPALAAFAAAQRGPLVQTALTAGRRSLDDYEAFRAGR